MKTFKEWIESTFTTIDEWGNEVTKDTNPDLLTYTDLSVMSSNQEKQYYLSLAYEAGRNSIFGINEIPSVARPTYYLTVNGKEFGWPYFQKDEALKALEEYKGALNEKGN